MSGLPQNATAPASTSAGERGEARGQAGAMGLDAVADQPSQNPAVEAKLVVLTDLPT